MTGYTVHTGSTVKYSNGWDNIFGGASGRRPAKATAKNKPSKKKSPPRAKKSK